MIRNEKIETLRNYISARIVGKEQVIENMIITLLAGGHVLLEDVPGVGKTTLAKSLAGALSVGFARIQCTPDSLPGDITGVTIYNLKENRFETILGPICHQIVLADELNRTSPKTQAALLEAMQERQVTIDNVTYPIPEPFMVIATQNPVESTGTYPLPEAELDRFMMKLSVGYPNAEETAEMARRFLSGSLEAEADALFTAEEICAMKEEVKKVSIADPLLSYVSEIAEKSHHRKELAAGISPRAVLSFLRAGQAHAYINGRNYCIPEDFRQLALPVLSHRLIRSSEARLQRLSQEEILRDIMDHVPFPS